MKQISTVGIILTRTNYGEADRIVTFLTPDQGKVRGIVKGARKQKSRLAGGIELFGVNDFTFVVGKSELRTIISTRIKKHFGNIVKDIERTMLGYEILKILNKVLEDEGGEEYYQLLEDTLRVLNTEAAPKHLAEASFLLHLMRLLGHLPNLATDVKGAELPKEGSFQFSFDDVAFFASSNGPYAKNHIKLLRLLAHNPAEKLLAVEDLNQFLEDLTPLVRNMARQYVVTF